MIDLYGVLQEQETINGELGLGVDYYKGEKGDTPIKGVDYFTTAEIQQIENNAAAKVDLSDYAKTADLSTVATSGSYNDLIDKPTIPSTTGLATETYVDDKIAEIDIPTVPTKVSAFTNDAGYLTEHQSLIEYAKKTDIPAPYTLPTASTSTLGGVKVDGNTITIADGIISSVGGSGGSEPEKYIKDASVSGNTLTLTKKDDTEVVFTPSGGSGGGSGYTLPVADMFTLGGVKLGNRDGLSITDNTGNYGASLHAGIEEAAIPIIPYARDTSSPGVVKVAKGDGLNYENGVISMSTATTTNYGTVAYDGKTIQAKLNSGDQPTLYAATATVSSLGVVKPDGTTTTVDSQGNLSMIGKPAVIKTLITGQAPDWVVDWVANPDKYIVMVNNCVVFKTIKYDNFPNFYYYWIDNDRIENYYIKFTDTTFTTPASSQPSYSVAGTQLITTDNWQNYITAGGGSDWQYTQDQSNSDLYNAKELVVYVENSNGFKQMGYFNFGADGNLGNSNGSHFYFDYNSSSPYISYDGSNLSCGNANNLQYICYKT